MEKLNWIPLKSVGPYILGGKLTKNQKKRCEYLGLTDITNRYNYDILDKKMSIYLEDKKIDYIHCYQELYYKGKNIIGLSLEEVVELIGIKPTSDGEIMIDDDPQVTYDIDKLELQLWVRIKDNIVVSASVSPSIFNDK